MRIKIKEIDLKICFINSSLKTPAITIHKAKYQSGDCSLSDCVQAMKIQELDHHLSLLSHLGRDNGIFFEEWGHLVPESCYARPITNEDKVGIPCQEMSGSDINFNKHNCH